MVNPISEIIPEPYYTIAVFVGFAILTLTLAWAMDHIGKGK